MTFAIHFADNDPHSPRNGAHQPVASGAAFIAEYGDELKLGSEALTAGDIDTLAVGEQLDIEGAWGEVISVTRVAPAMINAAPALLAALKPFVDDFLLARVPATVPDDKHWHEVDNFSQFTVGDFRRAVAVIAKATGA